jgi:nucleoid-associated protein YgaU
MKENIMKTQKMIGFILVAMLGLVLLSVQSVSAQNLSKSDWEEAMKAATARQSELTTQLSAVTKDVEDLKAQLTAKDADVKACEEALFALLGVTREQWEQFQKDLAQMERRVAELQGMSDDQLMQYKDEMLQLQSKLTEMSKSNIAKLSRFKTRIDGLQEKLTTLLNSLGGKEKSYTVGTWAKNHDCLWNIAKKRDIYNNAWMWPKIWQGNRDKIKDPDIIKPKWVLKIPEGTELSKEEKSAARKYYHKKAGAAATTGN